jgi:hypothetical protein
MLAVLPGTHSKWAIVEDGHLTAFATFMTGELFAVLLSHSILGRMADTAAPADATSDAFARGVASGLAGEGLSHVIFGARSLALMGELQPKDVGDWLSGALIGQEIRAARAWAGERCKTVDEISVIGGESLARAIRARSRRRDFTRVAARRRRCARTFPDRAARASHRLARLARTVAEGIPMSDRLTDFLEPLPLIAVLRGIAPEEIPTIGAALRRTAFVSSRCRSTRRVRSSPFAVSPTISATAALSVRDRHRRRRRRQSASGRRDA